ncbi:MAG: hypothetical protein GEEBNDBF_01392 [bacterium]|nr:hypothetical protein [bacterium]
MAIQVSIDGRTLGLTPEIVAVRDVGGLLVSTLTGGGLLWRGGRRQRLKLTGQGITADELTDLESLWGAGANTTLTLGADSWEIVLTRIERSPTLGSDRWTVAVECQVVG